MAKRKRIYRASNGAAFNDDTAEWIGKQIEIVESKGGLWGPQFLIEASKPKNSPGHKLFEWDIQRAAEKHWLEQAQHHLRHLDIEIVYEGDKQPIRAVYPVIIEDESGKRVRSYASYDRVQRASDLTQQVVERAKAELRSWRNRYSLYRGVFGKVFAAIDTLENGKWQPPQSTESRQTATRQRRKAKSARPRKSK